MAVLAVLAGALAWMSGAFHHKIAPGETRVELPSAAGRTLVPVTALEVVESVDAIGTIQPHRKTDVASQILATIREVRVNAGERVEAGQTLVVLDDREIQTQLREAEAALVGAEADLDVRQRDFKRYEELYQRKAATREEYDRTEGALKAAQAQVRRVEEQVSRVRVTLTYTEVKAQTAGIVADRYVDPGDLAVPGKPLLTLHDPEQRELHASVPESLTKDIHIGLEVPVRVDAIDRSCHGEIYEIVPQAQQVSRSVLVKVKLPPQAVDVVYIGMFGRLSIPTDTVKCLVIPAAAVREVGQEELVEVVTRENTLERRFVRTGQRHGDQVEILAGLEIGEQVALPPA